MLIVTYYIIIFNSAKKVTKQAGPSSDEKEVVTKCIQLLMCC